MRGQLFLAIISCLLISSCSNKTDIKEIKDHPREWVDKTVAIEGKVTSVFSLGFLNYFEINDGTRKIE